MGRLPPSLLLGSHARSTYLVEPKIQGEGDDVARVSPTADVAQLQLQVVPSPIAELQLVQHQAGAAPRAPAHHEGQQPPRQLQGENHQRQQ